MAKFKIAITGGPSGGKTTLIEALQKDMSGVLAVVPESASILYRGGFPRRFTSLGRKHTQRAICFTQRELEDMITADCKMEVIVCDRGSLDSVAYWPGSDESEFFKTMNTTRAAELSRYNWVLHLDTADEKTFDSSNPIRTESHKEAMDLNQKIREAWNGHPQRVIISNEHEFLLKIMRAKRAISMIMAGHSFEEIQKALDSQS